MCGINGIVRLSPDAPAIERAELLATRDAMRSRGPDGEGEWTAPDGRIALGHRRLRILDLSDAAAQPMASPDGRFHLLFNGEIYNFRELRQEIETRGAWSFRSTGDTEVVLALLAREGEAGLARLRGMFALALWDDREKRLLLARDPFGIKPLYYAHDAGGRTLRFASQVRALAAGGALPDEIDLAALAGFLLWGSVPEPRTLYRAVRAVPAGSVVVAEGGRVGEPRPIPGLADPVTAAFSGDADWPQAIEDSVRRHLVSDVPVAVFLSAGLDSTVIAAIARRHLPEPPTTFTLRFASLLGTEADEGPLAAEVAARLGTRHVERTVGGDELHALWQGGVAAMDQPSIDGFNTFLVSQLAAEAGIKVALSGLGGDELLGSYPSFVDVPHLAHLARQTAAVPGMARAWGWLGAPAARMVAPDRPKLAGLLPYGRTLPGAYYLRRGLFLPSELPALLGDERAREALALADPVDHAAEALGGQAANGDAGDDWRAVQALEARLYMRNQLLRDTDWASMAHSLEVRVPLVDARLWTSLAPAAADEARRDGKAAVLRRVAPELPAELFRKPKTGFYVPVMDGLDAPETPGHRGPERNLGRDSRRLALRLLAERGIELAGGAPGAPAAPGESDRAAAERSA